VAGQVWNGLRVAEVFRRALQAQRQDVRPEIGRRYLESLLSPASRIPTSRCLFGGCRLFPMAWGAKKPIWQAC